MPTPQRFPKESGGLEAAREWARWYLGDENYADLILWAELNPERARAQVAAERAR